MVGPFIFFDHMGPVEFAPGIPANVDVRPHPHIGLATLTYLFDGEIMHRDSVGSEQAIRPGEVNWMTAGRGITHSERFERARLQGGRMNGLQAWVALPESQEEISPSFDHCGADRLETFEQGGVWSRIAAGQAFGKQSAVKPLSPLFYVHQELRPGARSYLPEGYSERAAYIVQGEAEVEGRIYHSGQMIVFAPGTDALLSSVGHSVVMLLGGEPLGERFLEWNFVSSSKERIEQAKADWRAGRMKLPDFDNKEFIALPGDAAPPPNPMS
jgi:redox-sensitive bicupin YhaK (pirin superfamily)